MKILLYTKAFYPMVGGIETVSAMMAELFNKLGHECDVLTPVVNPGPDTFDYPVHRRPGLFQTIRQIREADIVISNGASLAMLPYCLLLSRPFIWVHAGYQASCVDGLGWVDGEPAPLTPAASLAFHYRKSGLLYFIKSAFKLLLRRFACRHLVAMNVAVSDWVAMRQPFPKQIRIYNPFPLDRFADDAPACESNYQFLYLGRLVSEKGVGTLIRALGMLVEHHPGKPITLLIIGDGNWQERLAALAEEIGIADHIIFAGRQTGRELVEMVEQCQIAVVPSEWEEPMGGVALELLAAGLPLIVSKNGGIAECAGEAALRFDNGDPVMLADCMARLLEDAELRASLRQKGREQLKKFDPEMLAREYISLFNHVLGNPKQERENEYRLAE